MLDIFIYALFYLYAAFCTYRIADRLGMENPWVAFVPVLNLLLLCAMIDRPLWYAVLFFIPVVNIVWSAVVWMRIAALLGHPGWIGVAIILPIATWVLLFYLAFAGQKGREQVTAPPA